MRTYTNEHVQCTYMNYMKVSRWSIHQTLLSFILGQIQYSVYALHVWVGNRVCTIFASILRMPWGNKCMFEKQASRLRKYIDLSLLSQNVCSTLWCTVGTTCHSKLDGAVDGTSCGPDKVSLALHEHKRHGGCDVYPDSVLDSCSGWFPEGSGRLMGVFAVSLRGVNVQKQDSDRPRPCKNVGIRSVSDLFAWFCFFNLTSSTEIDFTHVAFIYTAWPNDSKQVLMYTGQYRPKICAYTV